MVLGMNGARVAAVAVPPPAVDAPVADPENLLQPPTDITADEQTIWRELAPHALRERTLVLSRVPGFKQLCRQWVYCAALDERIRHLGITTQEADRLLRHFDKWEKALSASMGNFSIRSFGKPASPEKPKASANPFGSFGARG